MIDFVPTNEMGVIHLFLTMQDRNGYEVVEIGTSYPDAILKKDGRTYRVEFEYVASNFIVHRHDPRGCDFIICWRNDIKDENHPLSIIELSDPNWRATEIVMASERSIAEYAARDNRRGSQKHHTSIKLCPYSVGVVEKIRSQYALETTNSAIEMSLRDWEVNTEDSKLGSIDNRLLAMEIAIGQLSACIQALTVTLGERNHELDKRSLENEHGVSRPLGDGEAASG